MDDQSASNLKDVAVRGLLGKLPGNWPIIADLGLHMLGPNTDEALGKGKDFLGNLMGGYWEKMGERPASHVYGRLTDKANPKQMAGAVQKDRPRPEDAFFNPSGDVLAKSSQFLKDQGWRRGFYENPEMTAEAIGATTAAAPLIAGGLALNAFAQGGKPRSAYSNSVEGYDLSDTGSRSSNSYNPSVESARESARAKTELEQLKHAHAKELIELRGEAGTPGVQRGGTGISTSNTYDLSGQLNNIYGNRNTKYF